MGIARAVLFGALGLLMGCAPAPAVIADLESDKVVVQAGAGTPDHAIASVAAKGCAIHEGKPVRISHICLDAYCLRKNVLFACRRKGGQSN